MAVPLQNTEVVITFNRATTVDGRPKFTQTTRDTTGFITTEWESIKRGGPIPQDWEGKQRLQLTLIDDFEDDNGVPLAIEPNDDIIVNMDNELVSNKRFKIVKIDASPTGKLFPAWFLAIGEAGNE